MDPVAQTLHTIDVDLDNGRGTVQFALVRDANGEPESLVVSHGHDHGAAFHRGPWAPPPLSLPADALPRIREALMSLEEVEP